MTEAPKDVMATVPKEPYLVPPERKDSPKVLTEVTATVASLSQQHQQWDNAREAHKWEFNFQQAFAEQAKQARLNIEQLKNQQRMMEQQITNIRKNILYLEHIQHIREAPAYRKVGELEKARMEHELDILVDNRNGIKNMEQQLDGLKFTLNDHVKALDFFERGLVRIIFEEPPEKPDAGDAGIPAPDVNLDAFGGK